MPASMAGNAPFLRAAPLGPSLARGRKGFLGLSLVCGTAAHVRPPGALLQHCARGSPGCPHRPAGASLEFQGHGYYLGGRGWLMKRGLAGNRMWHQGIGSLQVLGGPTDSRGQHLASSLAVTDAASLTRFVPRASTRQAAGVISDRACAERSFYSRLKKGSGPGVCPG